MSTHTGTTTADELYHIAADGTRRELVRGEIRIMAPAGNEHGRIAVRITWRLAQFVEAGGLGAVYAAETGFLIRTDPDTVRAPDVAFVAKARLDAIGHVDGYWPGAPDLVIEVISPHDRYSEVEEKTTDWLDAGARMVFVVDPRRRTVAIHRSADDIEIVRDGDTLTGADVVPGWTTPVAEIFG